MAYNVHDTKFYQQGIGICHNMTNGWNVVGTVCKSSGIASEINQKWTVVIRVKYKES